MAHRIKAVQKAKVSPTGNSKVYLIKCQVLVYTFHTHTHTYICEVHYMVVRKSMNLLQNFSYCDPLAGFYIMMVGKI